MKTGNTASRFLAWTLAFILCFGGAFHYALADTVGETLDNQQKETDLLNGFSDGETEINEVLPQPKEPEEPEEPEDPPELENPGEAGVTYDAQPETLADVQAAIDAYNTEYRAALEAEGFLAALEVQKPHWQYEAAAELMPRGWHCELVDWDEDFGAEYYTFFPKPVAMAAGFGDGNYKSEPEEGTAIIDKFTINPSSSSAQIDNVYPNVAIITKDIGYQVGATWANDTLDLTLPFKTEMNLYLQNDADTLPSSHGYGDGMAFVLHNDSDGVDALGGKGEGLGVYQGADNGAVDPEYIDKCLAIEFDTYANHNDNPSVTDPGANQKYYHCALVIPADGIGVDAAAHKNCFAFDMPQEWALFTLEWTPEIDGLGKVSGILDYSFAGQSMSYEIDDAEDIFGGTEVFWGYTGSTGGARSVQAAAITKLPTQEISAVKTVKNSAGDSIDGGSAAVGDTLTYTVKVTANEINTGVGPVTVTDRLSEYTKYVGGPVIVETSGGTSFEVAPAINGNTMTIDTGQMLLSNGEWLSISFDVKALKNGIDKTVRNTARVSAEGLIEAQVSNTTRVSLDKSYKIVEGVNGGEYDGGHVKVGDKITYSIGYVNSTGQQANLVITDVLADGLDHVSGGSYDGGSHTVSWNISNVAAGGSGSVTLEVEVNVLAESVITNSAVLGWDTNSDGSPDDVETPSVSIPDSSYKIVAFGSAAGYGGASVKLGDELTFQIGYVNSTGKKADLKITDKLEDGFTYVRATDKDGSALAGYDGGSRLIEWEIDDVPAGGSGSVTLTVKVNESAGASITNKAVFEWTPEGGGAREEEAELDGGVTVVSSKLLERVNGKAAGEVAAVKPGDRLVYKIHYVNPTDGAADLTITDELDNGLTYLSSSGGGVYNSGPHAVKWEISNVPAGGSGFVTLRLKVNKYVGASVTNQALLNWEKKSGGTENETVEPDDSIPVESYKVAESVNGEEYRGGHVKVGDEITFLIGYVNPTGQTADLFITDTLGLGLTYISGGDYNSGTRTVSWEIANVPADVPGSVTLTVRVNENAESVVTNSAALGWDTDGSGTPDEVETPSVSIPDSSYKVVDSGSASGYGGAPVKLGDELTFRIGYVNNTGEKANLKITDKLEDGLTYVSATNKDGNALVGYGDGSRVVVWAIADVPAGGSGSVTLTVKVNENAEASITNKAAFEWTPETGGAKEEEAELDGGVAVVSSKLLESVNGLAVGKEASVKPGDRLVYKIHYVNQTGEKADLTITDALVSELTHVSSSHGGDYNSGTHTVKWEVDDVPVGGSGCVTLEVKVTERPGAFITNETLLEWDTNGGQPETEEAVAVNPVAYSVTYNANGGDGSHKDTNLTCEQQYSVRTQSATSITRGGYSFTGWNTGQNGKGTPYAPGDTIEITGDVTLYAQWRYNGGGGGVTPSAYSVTYHANGGTGGYADTGLKSGANYSVKEQSAAGISRGGDTFTGWDTKADGTGIGYAAGDTIKITGSVTLYAQWKENTNTGDKTYTVIYNPNGGTGTAWSVTQDVGSAHTVLANSSKNLGFTRYAYVFRGWSADPNAASAAYFGTGREAIGQSAKAGDTITLYAVWSKLYLPGEKGDNGIGMDDEDILFSSLDLLNHFAYIIGYPDGAVHPTDDITRAESATIFFRLLTQESREEIWSKTNSFTDVGGTAWYNTAVSTLANARVLKGYSDGAFKPDLSITRAEFAAIAVRFAKAEDIANATGMAAFSDISGNWAEDYIALAGALGYVEGYGDGTFRPYKPITRAEVTALLNNVLDRHVELEDDLLDGMITWPDNQPGTWYYFDMQEATNSHCCDRKPEGLCEFWTTLQENPDWAALETSDAAAKNMSE